MNAVAIAAPVAGGGRRLFDARQRALLTARWRALWVLAGFALVGAAALGRIGYLGLFEAGDAEAAYAGSGAPARGEIVDRNGVPLARMIDAYSLWFNPKALGGGAPLVKPPREVALALAQVFPDIDVGATEALLASGKPGYLRHRILPEEANQVHAIGEPAIETPRETERYYPQGSLAAHVLGFVGVPSDKRVRVNGQWFVVHPAHPGKAIGQVGMEAVLEQPLTDRATRGTPRVLSIDTRVQGALEDELARGIGLSNAKGAAGIVLDVDTGEVLALASLPAFNPNFIDRNSVPAIFNRATNQVYELGSAFKPITVASALDAGTVTDLARRYPASPFMMGRFKIHDSHDFGASLNVAEALIHSSNVVTAHIAQELGGVRLKATLERLGFNARPAIELPARGFPIWTSGEWPLLRTMTVSYGHGVAVTPMHLACAYAALVNGGVWRPATLFRLPPGAAPPPGRQVFSAATSARMRQLLRMIVVYGTGRSANAAGYRVGGKTGTAERPGAHGYQADSVITTFAAAFPMDHPRYVVIATLDEPQKTQATSYQRTAAWNAAPVVGRVVPKIAPMLGVMPDGARDIDIGELASLVPGQAGE